MRLTALIAEDMYSMMSDLHLDMKINDPNTLVDVYTSACPTEHCAYVIFVGVSSSTINTHTSWDLVLAVQNMDASGTVAEEQEIEFNALQGSLSMMSKG
jgi:hypothetical protein